LPAGTEVVAVESGHGGETMKKESCVTPEVKSEKEPYITPEVKSEDAPLFALAQSGGGCGCGCTGGSCGCACG